MTVAAGDSLKPGSRVGRFELQAELGRGGTGVVYRALDRGTGGLVALKTLEHRDPRLVALFEREYHTLASIKHPRVIEVYDFGIEAGRRFYTMEMLEGQDLLAVSPLPWRTACGYVRDVATSLSLVHGRRLIHRDVSPRNVRLDGSGRAKLIDFGTLCPFGAATELVGTPMCIAPEAVRRMELDQRTDLFSLGVIAYWALTGVKPFAISRLRDAEAAYRQPPPPSEHVADIPRALDHLVLSLLSIDPLGRPSSAAEVIDRLSTIAQLEDEPLRDAADSRLLSTALSGRERERTQLGGHLERAVRGAGGTVIIDGAAGMGRSRLGAELLLRARLEGVITMRVEALAHPEPGALMRALANELLQLAPAEAHETVGVHLPLLAEGIPGFADLIPSPARQSLHDAVSDPAERRARVQAAFVQWLIDVSRRRPIVVLVDDAHAVDSSSAGALVALGHAAQKAPLLVVATRLLGAESPIAVQQLARSAARIKLRGLNQDSLATLLASAFGEVPHRVRLAKWLHRVGHGNPGQSLELLRDLVDRRVIRYAGGTWELPAQLSDRDLPKSLEDALQARLRQLPGAALQLARLLALHQGALSIALCNQLMPELERAEVFGALDELLARDVVVCSGDSYRLRQDAWRALLLAPLDEARVRELHLALARALVTSSAALSADIDHPSLAAADPVELSLVLQAGWHFLRGGEDQRGSELLRGGGLELAHRGDGLMEAVPALRAALDAYRERGRSRYERVYLLIPLALAGAYADFRLTYRYSDELFDTLLDVTGVGMASRLAKRMPASLALALALPVGAVRYLLTRRRRATRDFREAILGLISIATGSLGSWTVLLDRARASSLLKVLSGLNGFPRWHAAWLVHQFQTALVETTLGHYDDARDRAMAVLDRLRRPGGVRGMPEDARVQIEVGVHTLLGSLNTYRVDGSARASMEDVDALRTAISRQAAEGIRASYHAMRGERVLFEQAQQEVDVLAAQAGSTWRQDVLLARNLWWTLVQCEDVMGLKRAVRQLEAVAEEAPSLADTRDMARASYLAERGMHEDALQQYAGVFERAIAEATLLSARYAAAFARILRKAGQPQRGIEICEQVLLRLSSAQREFAGIVHGVRLEHALSLAACGQLERAGVLLDDSLEAQQQHDNPMIHGLTHKARAQVALIARDTNAYERHLSAMFDWCRRTQNPALLGQCRELTDEGRRSGLLEDAARYSLRPQPRGGPQTTAIRSVLDACRGPAERLQAALDLVVERTCAEHAYLYLLEPSGLRFAAPAVGLEPPEELRLELGAALENVLDDRSETAVLSEAAPAPLHTVIEAVDDLPMGRLLQGQTYRSLLLTLVRGDELIGVGAIAIVPGEQPLQPVYGEFLEELARAIYDAGDVHTAYLAHG